MAGSLSPTVWRPASTSRVTYDRPVRDLDFVREGALRPSEQRAEHLAGLVGVVVDRLLAHDDKLRALLRDELLQDLGDGKRFDGLVDLDQDAAVRAHGERGADGFGRLLRTDRYGDDLGRFALFFQPDRLLDSD